MFAQILKKIIGTKSQRDIKRLRPLVVQINDLEAKYADFSEAQLKEQTAQFQAQLKETLEPLRKDIADLKVDAQKNQIQIEKLTKQYKQARQEALDRILPDAFAMTRKAAMDVLGLRHYDVQMMGGVVLHQGKIAEMHTGEGKTLVATLTVYLNALTSEGVHVVTVNDYLAERDRNWMGPVYEYLGLTVGVIKHGLDARERQDSYACDITYGTNNEFGFDYLRDNMVVDLEERVQRPLSYCIVDEVDSILIDEARTPLIISGPVDTVSYCFSEVKSYVRDVVSKQNVLMKSYFKNLKQAIDKDEEEEIGKWLYLMHRGAPKEEQFLSLTSSDARLKKLLEKILLKYASKDMSKERQKVEESLFYVYDEKSREVVLSAKGEETVSADAPGQFELEDISELILNIQNDPDLSMEQKVAKEQEAYAAYENKGKRIRSLELLLKAHVLNQKDVDYVVSDNKVVIVDEFTGRMMPGRRFGEGLHEALEAKEGVKIQRESQTLSTITFQNYFRMYDKLAGMTGTADTEAGEFHEIYKLDVVVVPTNKQLMRINHPDVIYKTEREKFNAVVDDIQEMNRQGRPVLVGTVSIEKSEKLSALLKRKKIAHEVLNAKHHAREADIITLAGQSQAVTIATNMAGRGTDIVLGDEVPGRGGLHVVGTERHESRRVDNQLRGRCGRQGDPGSARFYLSLEDDLMRLFGSDRIAAVMGRLGLEEGEDIQHPLINRAIETAQKRVEGQNFEIRKWLLKYDNVMNKQREVLYDHRYMVLKKDDLSDYLFKVAEDVTAEMVFVHWDLDDEQEPEEQAALLCKELFSVFRLSLAPEDLEGQSQDQIIEHVQKRVKDEFQQKISVMDPLMISRYVRWKLLETIDKHWKDHLYAMDELRESVNLRAYGQVDPLIEYQKEAHKMFEEMIENIKRESASEVFGMPIIHVANDVMDQLKVDELTNLHPEFSAPAAPSAPQPEEAPAVSGMPMEAYQGQEAYDQSKAEPFVRKEQKVGRNDPCPCGSGKKFKKCCGQA